MLGCRNLLINQTHDGTINRTESFSINFYGINRFFNDVFNIFNIAAESQWFTWRSHFHGLAVIRRVGFQCNRSRIPATIWLLSIPCSDHYHQESIHFWDCAVRSTVSPPPGPGPDRVKVCRSFWPKKSAWQPRTVMWGASGEVWFGGRWADTLCIDRWPVGGGGSVSLWQGLPGHSLHSQHQRSHQTHILNYRLYWYCHNPICILNEQDFLPYHIYLPTLP